MARKKQVKSGVPKNVVLPASLLRAIARKAENEGRPISAIVQLAIRKELGLPAGTDCSETKLEQP